MVDAFSKLTVDEYKTFTLSDSDSSQDSPASSNKEKIRSLNYFLRSCNKEELPVGQPSKPWDNLSSRSRSTYVSRATNAIVSVLEVIASSDADKLWEDVQTSKSIDKTLGTSMPAEAQYLTALAETYENASSWDTKRQVLAIMADLLSYRELQKFIPGVTEYRIKIARLHIKRYGRGSPLPESKSPRMKVDECQLDHFLSFITSSHVVQDLPFGQRYLPLSNGQILETQTSSGL